MDKSNWNEAKPAKIPRPTYAPLVTAIGVACILWSIASSPLILILGLALLVVGMIAWIREALYDQG